jgi:hypothetical protein
MGLDGIWKGMVCCFEKGWDQIVESVKAKQIGIKSGLTRG